MSTGLADRVSTSGVVTAVVLALGLGLELVLLASGDRAVTASLLLAAVLIEVLILQAVGRPAPPLVLIPVLLLGGIGLTGYLFYPSIADQAQVSAVVADNTATYAAAAHAFLVAGIAFTLGAAIVLGMAPSRGRTTGLAEAAALSIRPGLLMLAGWVPLVVLVYGKGRALLYATTYLAATGPHWAVSAGTSLGLVAILALAMAFYRTSGGVRFWAVVGLAAWMVALFAISTRTLAVVPALIVLARMLSKPGEKIAGRLVVAGVLSVLLLNLALTMRSSITGFGLRPFTHRLLSDPSLLIHLDPGKVFGNVLFSVPLAGQIAVYEPKLSGHDLVTSVNPMPGAFTDWATVAPHLRLNFFTPYSGLGELVNHGLWILAGYMAVAGIVLAVLHLGTRGLAGARGVAGSLLLLGLATLFTFDLLQYNLRSGTRILYYAVALVLLLRLSRLAASSSRPTPRSSGRTAPARSDQPPRRSSVTRS